MKLDARELVSHGIDHARGARYSCGLRAGQSEKAADAAVSAVQITEQSCRGSETSTGREYWGRDRKLRSSNPQSLMSTPGPRL